MRKLGLLCVLSLSLAGFFLPLGGACTIHQFECDNRCIPRTWVCDGQNDCLDESDEYHCTEPTSCLEGEFQCNSSNTSRARCISSKLLCDGEFDCADMEDELNCAEVHCRNDTFICALNQSDSTDGVRQFCAPNSWRCDGQVDCADGSDENGCNVASCPPGDFQCNNGRCIDGTWRCDGEKDCFDSSDEELCEHFSCPHERPFFCDSHKQCIPMHWRCDGDFDCADRSDEVNCAVNRSRLQCNSTEFACKSGKQCIRSKWVCDGDYDCSDRSDETDCKLRNCTNKEKMCDVGRCRPKNLWCDGKEDCFDGSDEDGCEKTEPNIICNNATHFTCPHGAPSKCIQYKDLCQHPQADCGQTVCHTNIENCLNGSENCNCRRTPQNGTICYCKPGFESRGNRCVDINECRIVGICDHRCINLQGSYECRCHRGYHLMRTFRFPLDQHHPSKCRALGSEPRLLLFGRSEIRELNLITLKYGTFMLQHIGSSVADFFFEKRTIVFSNVADKSIMYCQMKKDRNECENGGKVLIADAGIVKHIAADWVHDLLFWSQKQNEPTEIGRINVLDMKSLRWATVYYDGATEPDAIVVDPSMGLIFWTDTHLPCIQRAGMNGKGRAAFHLGDHALLWPTALTVDLLDKRLYWTDAKLKHIASCDYFGDNIRIVRSSHQQFKHPFSLSVFEDRVYWSDRDDYRIQSVDKFTGADLRLVLNAPAAGHIAMRIYHELVQPSSPDKCMNNRCGHLCLPQSVFRGINQPLRPFECVCKNVSFIGSDVCVANSGAFQSTDLHHSILIIIVFFVGPMLVLLMLVIGYIIHRFRKYRLRQNSRYSLLPTVRYHKDSSDEADD